jgi:hypothetical protein
MIGGPPSRLRVRARRVWVLALALLLVTPASALLGWTAYDLYRSHANHRAHSVLKLGMSAGQVHGILGRKPDCVVRLARSQVFFFADAFGVDPCPASVAAPSELPRAYDSLQVLMGPDGRVAAFTLDGESCVLSAKCRVRGQGLAEMSAECVD